MISLFIDGHGGNHAHVLFARDGQFHKLRIGATNGKRFDLLFVNLACVEAEIGQSIAALDDIFVIVQPTKLDRENSHNFAF